VIVVQDGLCAELEEAFLLAGLTITYISNKSRTHSRQPDRDGQWLPNRLTRDDSGMCGSLRSTDHRAGNENVP
jgi:hypothetical protein